MAVFGPGAEMYEDALYQNDVKLGARVERLQPSNYAKNENGSQESRADSKTLSQILGSDIGVGERICSAYGYLNADGGWVNSRKAMERAMCLVQNLGGRIIAGKEVSELVKTDSHTSGVKCKDGSEYSADIVVIATGSWTASAFPHLNLGERCHATG